MIFSPSTKREKKKNMSRPKSWRTSSSEADLPFVKDFSNQEFELTSRVVEASKGTLLHHYAKQGNKKMTKYLINNGYNVNTQDFNGNTALMLATEKKLYEITGLLLSAGSDITIKNKKNKSALSMVCADEDFISAERKLFFDALCKQVSTCERRATILMTAGCPLYQALGCFSVDVVDYMAVKGLPVNSTTLLTKQSALHVATIMEDIDCVNVLLKHKADVNAQDVWGDTPLACIYKFSLKHTSAKVELLKIFLNLEVSPTSNNSSGSFQTGFTFLRGNNKAIQVVLQSKIDFLAKDRHGRNMLHYIAQNVNPGVIEELKLHVHKFDLTAVDGMSLSPLHVAVQHGNSDMVQVLLQHGVTPNGTHKEFGYTPIYYAYAKFKPEYECQFDQCVQMLLENGADPQRIFMDEETSEQLTIFDVAKRTNSLSRMRPVLAQLAVIKGLGVSVNEIISASIVSHPELRKYFKTCQSLIKSKVFGTVTLLKLLTSHEKALARYSNNKELMLKLMRLSHKQDFKTDYSYYYNTLYRRLSSGIQHRIFLDKTAKVLCKICQNRFNQIPLIVNKIIEFLNYESLEQLHQL